MMIYDIRTNYTNITAPTPYFIVAMALIAHLYISEQKKEAIIGTVLLMVTFFASLGTGVDFSIRAAVYCMPIIVFVYHQIFTNKRISILTFTIFLLIFSLLRFSIEFITTSGWNGYVISKQTENIKDNGYSQSIKLDKQQLAMLSELKTIIPPQSKILVSVPSLWGFVYLLDGKPPILYFKYNEIRESTFLKNIKYHPTEVFLLESKNSPFPKRMYIKQQYNVCDTFLLITNNDKVLYRLR
jgi:hypothetical protein